MTATPLGDLPLIHANRKSADALAIIYPEECLAWAELERRANRRARLYRSMGVGLNDFVTLALPNGPDFHEALFAIWKLGATPNILSSRLPTHEFLSILKVVKPSLVIGGPDKGALLEGWRQISGCAPLHDFDDAAMPSDVALAWRAMATGGSTGLPRVIVERKPAEIDLDLLASQPVIGLNANDVLLNPGVLYHSAPFLATHMALFLGASVIGMVRFDAEEVLRLISRHRVTMMTVVPTMMRRIWALPKEVRDGYDVSSLRMVWHFAAPCPPWLKEAWIDWLGPDRVWELYGGSESIGAAVISGREWLAKRGSVGRLAGGGSVKVIANDGGECPPGEVGELFFKGTGGAPNTDYLGVEVKSLGDGWYSYGDLGHVDSDGYIFLADRRVDLILRGGANIYPAEVEAAIEAHPEVECAVVVGLPCEDLGQRVHAIVKPSPGTHPTARDLTRFLVGRIAAFKLPESYEFSEAQLRDDAGKVRRSALRDERAGWLRDGVLFQQFARREESSIACHDR